MIIVVGDACGRGPSAAALLAPLRPRLDELALAGVPPAVLLSSLNRRASERLPIDRFVTVTAMELDATTGALTIASAGHVPVILRRADGAVMILGRASGPPLGVTPNAAYSQEAHEVFPGDVLVLMTDGVLEAIEPDLDDMQNLSRLVREAPGDARAVHDLILNRLDERPVGIPDDMTLVSVGLLGDASAPDSAVQRGMA